MDGTTFGPDLVGRAHGIEALILDVDGTLTDGGLYYAEYGDELKRFDVQDGAGLVFWHLAGFRSAIISGRKSKLVLRRAKELRIEQVFQGVSYKLEVYERLLKRWHFKDEQVCVIGDDLPELSMLRRAGLSVAVANAAPDVKRAAHYQTARAGGRGAIREIIELLLQAKGVWDQVLERYP